MATLKDTTVLGSLGVTDSVTINGNPVITDSKAAASSGTSLSLVTTGEKYTWNNKLGSHQTIKQDGVTGATVNRFGTCSTAAGTAAKTVSITTGTFALEAGAMVAVKFSNANTAGTPTLNVASKGAKNIFVNGAQITTGGNKALLAGTVLFIYDGTQWHLIGNYYDTDTTNFVPLTRTVNGKALSADITLSASDVGALPSDTSYVPTSRTINSKALTSNISLTASDVGALSSHQTIKQDGVTGATVNRFGTCSTAAGTAAKTVSITTGTFALEAGSLVAVSFTNANTASNPTLNVDSKGAKNIFVNGARITTGGNKGMLAGTVLFIYDGTQWHLIGNYYDTDTTTFVPTTRKVNNKALSGDISLTASDVGALSSHQTIKQDGVTGATVNRFGTCSTAAATAAKTVSITTGTFALEAGSLVAVKFTNANTAGTPTLNVDSKGAKNIFVNGAQITTGGNKALLAGTVLFIYDGTQWHLIGNYYDTDTTTFVPTTRTVNSKALSSDITLTASDVGALSSHQTIKQDGITGATVNRFGTCSTAAGTAAKTVSITTGTFALEAGSLVAVKFSNANTARTPTLNVASKGAKNIFVNGAQITTGSNKALLKGTVLFIYDGTQWHLIGNYYDTTTTTNSSDTSSKIFLIGATSQTTSASTYSHDTAYVGTDGCLYSNSTKVLVGSYSASTAPTSPTTGYVWLKQASMSIEEAKVLVVSGSVSSLPTTISDSNITEDMVVLNSVISNPAVQTSNWTVTTAAGTATISGTISGTTTIALYLMRSR